jgi:tetratricopeptide (TPR) repeat protein
VKALEKDRTRRYESASAFAADVERYLADEPVEACPPSAAYRLRKFVRRNKGALVTAAVLIVTLLAGTGVSVWQAIDATSARKLADERLVLADSRLILADERLKSEKQARHDADTQRQEANAQRQLAEANFRKARDAVDQMLTRVADEKLASIPGVEAVRKQLLEDALKFYQEFLEQRADDPELRFEVAQAWRRVGFIQDLLTNFDEARTALEHAVGIVEELSGEHHDNPQYLEFLGESYGRLSSARSLAVANAVANDEINERVLDRGLVACVHLQRLFPDKAEYCQLTAGLQFLKATLYKWTGRTTEALVLTREAIKTQRELLAEAPDNGRDATNYLACNLFLLATMVAPSNFEEADRLFAEAQTLAEAAVGRDNPDRARSGYYDDSELFLFGVLSQRAALLLGRGQIAEPEAMLRRALALMDRHIAAHPNFDAPRIGRARDRMNLANLLTETGRNDQVEALHRQARRDLDAGVAWPAASYLARYQHALLCLVTHDEAAYRAECTDMLRRFHDSQNPLELHFAAWTCALAPNAVADMDDAIALARRCVEIAPARKGFVQGLGATLFRAGRFEEALEALDRSESAKNDPVTSLVYGWYFRAMTCFRMGKADEARQWYDKAVAETTKLLTDNGTIGTEPVPWNRRLMLELLRAEASLMLGITANTGTRDAATRPNDPQPEARSGSP